MLELPITNDPAQRFVSQLGEKKYQFDIQYNSRSGIWTFGMAEENGDTLLAGRAMVLGADLLLPFNLGIGRLFMVDYMGTGKDATADDLGTRVGMVWVAEGEEADVAASV